MSQWEKLCKRCGLCCFEKSVDLKGQFYTTKTPCQHLDIVTRECRVYNKRLDVGEGCIKLTPELIEKADWLPEDCGYKEIRTKVQG